MERPGIGGPLGIGMPSFDDCRPPVPSDDAVQCTHIDAALAKICCAKLGYFEDHWTEQLIRNTRPTPRSPLIHRGYYSRVAAMRRVVSGFLDRCPCGSPVQLVNLGAGMDSLYFWLRESPTLWRDNLVFFEVDFPEVLSKKVAAILKRQNLWPLLDASSAEELIRPGLGASGTRELRTPHCRYVPTDMRIVPELAAAMTGAGFRSDVPTLFLSECVLVYMQAMHGDAIIEWAGSAVQSAPSAFVVYEQSNPNDAFGKIMVDNLMQRGCPLLSIHDYPSLESQQERYRLRGWEQTLISDMNEVYDSHLDRKDVERIQRLELLDEFEEWHLIQAHYFLMVATRSGGSPIASVSGEDAMADGDPTPASDSSWIHSVLPPPAGGSGIRTGQVAGVGPGSGAVGAVGVIGVPNAW